MEDEKIHSFFATDSEGERNFRMMKQRTPAPGIPGYPGFYSVLRPIPGVPRISHIRHVLPQIPTRAWNPRTAVSKASLLEQFPSLPRSDVVHSNLVPDYLRNREVIWKEDCKGSSREFFNQGEVMTKVISLDLPSSGNESVQDMSVATARTVTQSKGDNGFFLESDFHEDVGPKKETVDYADHTLDMNQPTEFENMDEQASIDENIVGVDDQKDISNSESDIDCGSSFRVLPVKSKETAAHAHPIKLKIRCNFKQGQKELMAIIGSDSGNDGALSEATVAGGSAPSVCQASGNQSSLQGPSLLTPEPPSPQIVLHSVPVPSPSTSVVRPKTGRAKTNAELKKQLMEKRAVQYLKGQGDGGSQASSPASPLSTPTEGMNTDVFDSEFDRSALSKTSQNGKGTGCKTSSARVPDRESLTFGLSPVETKWIIGDLLWTRVAGHPWWPCIVSPDPFQRIYTKVISRGQKASRQYHVKFFGEEGERGWVLESTAIPFEGRTKFETFCDEMIKEHKKNRRNYSVTPNRRRAWDVAVTDAEHALTMPRECRIEEYLTVHDSIEPVMTPWKANCGGKASASSRSGSPPHKKQRLSESAVASPSLIKLPKNVSNQHVIQYAVFCQKRRESVKNEHPEYDNRQVEDCLRLQWSRLDDDTRSRFIPMGSDLTSLSQMMASVDPPKVPSGVKRSSRFIRTKQGPTLKKLVKEKCKEAAETNEDVGKKRGILKEEKRIPRQRTSTERKLMKIVPVYKTPASKVAASNPVSLPLSVAASAMVPLKKRGCKPNEARRPLGETSELDVKEDEAAKKVSASRIQKDTIVCSDGKATEEELDCFDVCFICEKSTEGVEKRRGQCHGSFHHSCLGRLSAADGELLGEDSATDSRKCFACKNSDAKVVPCSVPDCGRWYHKECLSAFLPEGLASDSNLPFSCPLHSCFTCQLKKQDKGSISEGDNDTAEDLVTCVRCPTAYHVTDCCVSAGSLVLTPRHIVCGRHFEPSKSQSLHTKTSCSWCFVCEKGGSLLSCDRCPGAYHSTCLEISVPLLPSPRAWQCPDCSCGKTPLYGDLVWVKFGSYRWWPAEIYHPASLPSNIQDLPHRIGEFPVCFFGSHDYLWIHRGRVFPFREGDKCCREANSRGTAKMFDKATKEAIAVFRMLNPNAKPLTNDMSDRNMDRSVAEKMETNHDGDTKDKQDDDADDDDDYIGGCDGGDDDDDDAETGVLSSRKKSSTGGGRKTKSTKVQPNHRNNRTIRELRRQNRVLSAKEAPHSSGKGRMPKMVNGHETKCYRCGRDGSLILCDKIKCAKAFHLKCINKSRLPHGVWLCPWHHCDVCGKAATQLCSCCPSSYCPDHILNNIVFSHELGAICSKHKDVKVEGDSLDTTLSLASLNCTLSSAQSSRSRSKEFVETHKEKQGGTSVKRNSAVDGRHSNVLPHKLADHESGADDLKSENGWLNVVENVARPVNKNRMATRKRGVRPKMQLYVASNRKSEKWSRPTRPSLEPGHSTSVSCISSKPASHVDPSMFDNSDDEFPRLVIDVPTV